MGYDEWKKVQPASDPTGTPGQPPLGYDDWKAHRAAQLNTAAQAGVMASATHLRPTLDQPTVAAAAQAAANPVGGYGARDDAWQLNPEARADATAAPGAGGTLRDKLAKVAPNRTVGPLAQTGLEHVGEYNMREPLSDVLERHNLGGVGEYFSGKSSEPTGVLRQIGEADESAREGSRLGMALHAGMAALNAAGLVSGGRALRAMTAIAPEAAATAGSELAPSFHPSVMSDPDFEQMLAEESKTPFTPKPPAPPPPDLPVDVKPPGPVPIGPDPHAPAPEFEKQLNEFADKPASVEVKPPPAGAASDRMFEDMQAKADAAKAAEPAPAPKTVPIRDASGRPRASLKNVSTKDLLDEYRRTSDAQSADLDAVPRYQDIGEDMKYDRENAGHGINPSNNENAAPEAGRGRSRSAFLKRMEAEMSARNLTGEDVASHAEQYYAEQAKAAELKHEQDWEREGMETEDESHAGAPSDVLRDESGKELFMGPGLTAGQKKTAKTFASEVLEDPHAGLEGPEKQIGHAIKYANATHNMPEFTRQQAEQALGGLRGKYLQGAAEDPANDKYRQASRLISLDQYEAEASRKALAAERVKAASEAELASDTEAAEKHRQAGLARAYAGKFVPEAEPGNVDVSPDARAVTARQQELLAGEAQRTVDQTAKEVDAMHAEAQRAHQQRMDEQYLPLQEAAHNHLVMAEQLRPKIDPVASADPEIKAALAKFKGIKPLQDRTSIDAGVDPANFRKPEGGIYQRLIPLDRLRESDIDRAQRIAAAAGREPGAEARAAVFGPPTKPRTGLARALLGQKRDVLAASPSGLEAPAQGPFDARGDTRGGGGLGRAGTQVTGSAKMATGAANQYLEDDAIAAAEHDMREKAPRAATNRVFQAVANAGHELGPNEKVPIGSREIAFNNTGQIVDAPSQGDAPGLRRYAVSEKAYKAVQSWRQRELGPSDLARALGKLADKSTEFTLANPAVAPFHVLREAGSVGTNAPPGANPLQIAAGALPGYKSIEAITRANRLDMASDAMQERLQRGARNGWLRISDPRELGDKNPFHAGAKWLFDTRSGQDTKLRMLASSDFEKYRQMADLPTKGPEFEAAERKYVVGHAGEPVGANRGTAMSALRSAQPFVQTHYANLATSAKALVGEGGIPNATEAQKFATLLRGPVGKSAVNAGISKVASGHNPESADIEPGIYHEGGKGWTDPSSYHHETGSPDDARQKFGAGTTSLTLRDPGTTAIDRGLVNTAAAPEGHKVTEALRNAVNTAGSFVTGPLVSAGFTLATGKEPYFDRSGNLASIQNSKPALTPDESLSDRLKAALVSGNAGTRAATGGAQDVTGAFPAVGLHSARSQAVSTQLHDLPNYVSQVTAAIGRAKGDSAEINRIKDEALARLEKEEGISSVYAHQINVAANRAISNPERSFNRATNRNPGIK